MRFVFDEATLQPLTAIDVDQHRSGRLAQQALQCGGVDDLAAFDLLRGRAAIVRGAIAVGGEQRRRVSLGDT
ncbi:hypothetical protein D3C80_1337020 [compost metagenome]